MGESWSQRLGQLLMDRLPFVRQFLNPEGKLSSEQSSKSPKFAEKEILREILEKVAVYDDIGMNVTCAVLFNITRVPVPHFVFFPSTISMVFDRITYVYSV